MLIFKENLLFQVDQDYFKISTNGEFGDANIKYLHGENINTTVTSMFSIPKLQDILKSSKFSNEAELHLGDDMPLRLTLKLNTGDGELRYLLAPRIELDD